MKKMLKIVLPCFLFIFLIGCELNNTPTSKVEEKLSNYNMIDKKIDDEIEKGIIILSNGNVLTNTQQEKYRKIVEKQLKNLVYEVKEEVIDGNNATITVEIEVLDYKKVLENNNSLPKTEENINKTLDELDKSKDKITYTIDFFVTKENNNWKLNDIDEITFSKILGIY